MPRENLAGSPLVTEINFGVSNFVEHAQGIPKSDNIVRIPETGKLPTIGERITVPASETGKSTTWINREENWCGGAFEIDHYQESVHSEPHLTAINHLPAVEFSIPSEKTEVIILIWIEARGEWVAIYKNEWLEGPEGTDELYLGPFSLDEIASQKILQVYNLTPELLSLENVKGTKPERLQYLTRNKAAREMLLEGNI